MEVADGCERERECRELNALQMVSLSPCAVCMIVSHK